MKYAFIEAEKGRFPVVLMCKTLGVSRSGYYAWRTTRHLPDLRHRDDEDELRRAILRAHRSGRGAYGRPRIHLALRARGWRVGAQRIRRIMTDEGLRGRGRRPSRRVEAEPADQPALNELDRNFEVSEPNRVWLGDITYIEVAGVFWYLAVVIDLFSRRVVGWHLADHADAGLVVKALRVALDRRRPVSGALLFHSDQGVQYRSKRFRRVLEIYGVGQSMSRRGNCWDNAPAEAFFASLKLECVDRAECASGEDLRGLLTSYIDDFYNKRRIHTTLGQSPQQYEDAA